jgi:hypothetical protein
MKSGMNPTTTTLAGDGKTPVAAIRRTCCLEELPALACASLLFCFASLALSLCLPLFIISLSFYRCCVSFLFFEGSCARDEYVCKRTHALMLM